MGARALKFGHMSPLAAGDNRPHEFARVFPPACEIICYPLNLKAFSGAAVDEALGAFWTALEALDAQGVSRIALGGIPVAAMPGRRRIQALMDEARRRTSTPVTAVFEDVIDALHASGINHVAVAAKWGPELMAAVANYLADAGITVAGIGTRPMTAEQVVQLSAGEGTDLAVELGRLAFRNAPDAEALLLAGGAWRSLDAVPILEAEFDKLVINNSGAEFWACLRMSGMYSPHHGLGRLLDSLAEPIVAQAGRQE